MKANAREDFKDVNDDVIEERVIEVVQFHG